MNALRYSSNVDSRLQLHGNYGEVFANMRKVGADRLEALRTRPTDAFLCRMRPSNRTAHGRGRPGRRRGIHSRTTGRSTRRKTSRVRRVPRGLKGGRKGEKNNARHTLSKGKVPRRTMKERKNKVNRNVWIHLRTPRLFPKTRELLKNHAVKPMEMKRVDKPKKMPTSREDRGRRKGSGNASRNKRNTTIVPR